MEHSSSCSSSPSNDNNAFDLDVLVVGGGPTGLMFACTLLQASQGQAKCRVIEKLLERHPYSKAFVTHVRTLEHLSYLGGHDMVEKLRSQGSVISRYEYHAPQKLDYKWDLDFADINYDAKYKGLLIAPQANTEVLLEGHLKGLGVKLERGVEMVSLQQQEEKAGGGVLVTLRYSDTNREEQVRCRYVVGADGAHSSVRKALKLDFEGVTYPGVPILAEVKLDGPVMPDQHTGVLSGRGDHTFFLAPLKGGIYRIATHRPDSNNTAQPTLEEFDAVLQPSFPGIKCYDPTWLSAFKLHRRVVSKYNVGNVFLAGDAAHIHSPVGGQGLNMSVQDGFNLGWKLALVLRGLAKDDPLLQTYHNERRRTGTKICHWIEDMATLVGLAGGHGWRAWVARVVRHTMIRLFPSVRENMIMSMTQLYLSYRGAASVKDEAGWWWRLWGVGPMAGDRALDGDCGGGKRLLDVLSDGSLRHTLLVFGVKQEDALKGELAALVKEVGHYPEMIRGVLVKGRGEGDEGHLGESGVEGWEVLRDRQGVLHQSYGDKALYLIRPDGYVAYRCRGWDARGLVSFLGQQGCHREA